MNSIKQAKVLVVDDEPMNLKLLNAILPSELYDTILVSNGADALKKVETDSPDIILLDIMMPNMNGYEVTTRLKENPETRDIPIILITALDDLKEKIKGLEVGADEFLNKPVNSAELKSRVKSLVRFKQYQDELKSHGHSTEANLKQHEDNPPRILLVEDEEKDVKIIKGYLQEEPYQIDHVYSGEDALSIVSHEKIDLVLLDILLPKMNGFDVIHRLREMESASHLQILAITNLQELEHKVKGIELGADDYLIKPVNKHELKLRVKTLIKKKAYLDMLSGLSSQVRVSE